MKKSSVFSLQSSVLALIACVVSLLLPSCATQPVTVDSTMIARAEKAASAANEIINTAQTAGQISAKNADRLRDEISLASRALALTGHLDFTSARSLAATMAASGLLPPNTAMAIQAALLLSDLGSDFAAPKS